MTRNASPSDRAKLVRPLGILPRNMGCEPSVRHSPTGKPNSCRPGVSLLKEKVQSLSRMPAFLNDGTNGIDNYVRPVVLNHMTAALHDDTLAIGRAGHQVQLHAVPCSVAISSSSRQHDQWLVPELLLPACDSKVDCCLQLRALKS